MKKFELGIRADWMITQGSLGVRENFFIGIGGGKILELCPWKPKLKSSCKKFMDARGMACLPGFVNGHTHLPMSLFRGVEDDVPFHTWLFERILPLEGQMVSKQFVKDGTELSALECLRFGTTTVNEMYFYAAETAAVLDKAGLRAIVSQTLADFPLPEDKDLGTDKFALVAALRKKYSGHKRISIGYAPHAPYSCKDELLRRVGEASLRDGAPVHIHVSETQKEVSDSLEQFGLSPVERLKKLGLMRKGVHCAHSVHLSKEDEDIFSQSGASIVHNPDSNCKLGSGLAPIAGYRSKKIPLALGTDGAASSNNLSIYGAMNLATKLQKLHKGDSTAFTAAQALHAATLGGAEALGMEKEIGSLEIGKRADLQLVDFSAPHMQPVHDPVSQLVYSATGMEVATVVCEGKILFHQGKFTTLNEKSVLEKAERWRKKIQQVLGKMR